jgi:hypothetical protein
MRTALIVLALSVPLAACSDDDASGFAGDYQTTAIESRTGCTGSFTTEAIPAGDEYFRLIDEDFLGVSMLGWHTCTAAATCADSMSLFSSFAKDGAEWRGDVYVASGGGTSTCYLGADLRILERVDATTIRVRTEAHSLEDATLTEEECSTDNARARLSEMTCDEDGQQTATLL